MSRYILLIIALGCFASTRGETVYVSDILFVPLRGGQSTEHKILHKGIRSGTALELLEENETTGYSRIRMVNGLEGWIKSQYLSEELIARHQLDGLRQRISELQADMASARQNVVQLKAKANSLDQAGEEMQKSNVQLTSELNRITALADDTIQIDQDNLHLKEENKSLLDELDTLSQLNKNLEDDSNQLWFLKGAGTVLFGLLIGIWVGRRIYNRQTGGWY